jgi:hypothetical protein
LLVIVVVALSVLLIISLFAIAIARAAASGDEAMDRLIAERRRELSEGAKRAEAPPARERALDPRAGSFSSRASTLPSPDGVAAGDDRLVGSRTRRRRRRRTPTV